MEVFDGKKAVSLLHIQGLITCQSTQFESDHIIDIRSPAAISDFEYIKEIEMISFSIDSPQYIILYIPSEFVPSDMIVTVNGQIPRDLVVKNNILEEEITMISFVPQNSGIVMISSLGNSYQFL